MGWAACSHDRPGQVTLFEKRRRRRQLLRLILGGCFAPPRRQGRYGHPPQVSMRAAVLFRWAVLILPNLPQSTRTSEYFWLVFLKISQMHPLKKPSPPRPQHEDRDER